MFDWVLDTIIFCVFFHIRITGSDPVTGIV